MEKHCKVRPIIGMDENPWHYRHKVQAVFGLDRKKQQISGVYEEKTHRILPVETCLIEDQKADAIIATVRSLLKSFKIKVYDEDTGYGLLRYVLIRKAEFTDEIMVVLVTASPVFPSKRNFVEALRREHPEITTGCPECQRPDGQPCAGQQVSGALGQRLHCGQALRL